MTLAAKPGATALDAGEDAIGEGVALADPSARASQAGGTCCTNIDATWRPGGASVASSTDGIVSSIIGSDGKRPLAASAKERSSASRSAAPRWIVPRCSGRRRPRVATAKARQAVEREIDLHDGALHVERAQRGDVVLGQLRGVQHPEQRALRVGARRDQRRFEAAAVLERDAAHAPAGDVDRRDRRVDLDRRAGRARGVARSRRRARPCRPARRPTRRARRRVSPITWWKST